MREVFGILMALRPKKYQEIKILKITFQGKCISLIKLTKKPMNMLGLMRMEHSGIGANHL